MDLTFFLSSMYHIIWRHWCELLECVWIALINLYRMQTGIFLQGCALFYLLILNGYDGNKTLLVLVLSACFSYLSFFLFCLVLMTDLIALPTPLRPGQDVVLLLAIGLIIAQQKHHFDSDLVPVVINAGFMKPCNKSPNSTLGECNPTKISQHNYVMDLNLLSIDYNWSF